MASDSSAQAGSSGQAVFHRLVRSLSGLSTPSSSVQQPAPILQTATTTPALTPTESTGESATAMPASSSAEASTSAGPSSTLGEPLQRVSSASSSIKKARSKIADRLKQLGKDLGKLRRGNSSKSVPASPRVTIGEVVSSTAASAGAPEHSGHAKLLSMVAEQDEPEGTIRAGVNTNSTDHDASASAPSAMTLAKRIQSLIDALPFPSSTPKHDIPIPQNPSPPDQDPDGHPIFPPNTTPVRDGQLISLLSSPSVMNGSMGRGRPSIWSVLEALGVPPHGFPSRGGEESAEGDREGGGGSGAVAGQLSDGPPIANPHPILSDDTSVLLYSPLFPSAEDLVELGEQVPITVDEVVSPTPWTSVWPLSLWYGEASASAASAERGVAPRTSIDAQGRVIKVQTVQAWVPSTTKLSVQALWWGYRLYLPPPVLASLGDETLEATKRAAMITTALTWFFNNLPVSSLPAALQPAALLLQRLAPYLGYIGTFISWSWSTIKSHDIGYGVILSATWLLPVALIPGTWKATDFPTSPGQGTPAPLPPQTTPTPTPSSPPTSLPTSPSTVPSTTPTPTSPTPSSPPLTSTSPTPTSPTPSTPAPTTSPTTPTSPTTTTSARRIAHIPVAPLPPEDTIPPIPPVPVPAPAPAPVPMPMPVPPDSPLAEQLLHGPLMAPVPLPEEGEGADGDANGNGEANGNGNGDGDGDANGDANGNPQANLKQKKGVKSRTRALFARSPKV